MINLRTRTEYSFRTAYGPIDKIISDCKQDSMGICDMGTWGHVAFDSACRKAEKKPIFGVELAVVEDATERSKQPINLMGFIAKNNQGLQELYQLVTKATDPSRFYYVPRLSYEDLFDVSKNIIMLSGTNPMWGSLPITNKENLYIELNPMTTKKSLNWAEERGFKVVATSDNFFPKVTDRKVYEVLTGRNRYDRTKPMHILEI